MVSIGRRTFIQGSAASGAVATLAMPSPVAAQGAPTGKPPIVLVHGGWHGGWCWKRVAPKLRAAGREAFTPTLTGLGERVHLGGREVDLEMHIADIVQVLEAEELSDALLVGHSYAGMVITGVADRLGARLRGLVYLDAFVPENGRSLLDYIAPARRPALVKAGEAAGFLESYPVKFFGITDPADAAWVGRRVTRQSYATFKQPLTLQRGGGARLPRSFVYCSDPPTGSFGQFAERLRNDPAWRFYELRTGHDCMITDPDGVARVLLDAASR
jgi:pimeloyl-ACP methyl ester carboxylesterase